MKKFIGLFAIASFCCLLLNACGQMGRLYLPNHTSPTSSASQAAEN